MNRHTYATIISYLIMFPMSEENVIHKNLLLLLLLLDDCILVYMEKKVLERICQLIETYMTSRNINSIMMILKHFRSFTPIITSKIILLYDKLCLPLKLKNEVKKY